MSATEVSRDPSDYYHGSGGHSRRRSDEHEIPEGVIEQAIESGDIVETSSENSNNYVKLRTEYLGYEIFAVVNPENNEVVTCFGDDDWKDAGL